MTPSQQATIAFLATVIRTRKFSRSHNTRVYLISQRDYTYVLRGEFYQEALNLKIEPNNYRVYKDELEFRSGGTVKLKVRFEDKFSTRIEMIVAPNEATFRGRVNNGTEFRAEFDGNDVVKITDPDKNSSVFAYRVELY